MTRLLLKGGETVPSVAVGVANLEDFFLKVEDAVAKVGENVPKLEEKFLKLDVQGIGGYCATSAQQRKPVE